MEKIFEYARKNNISDIHIIEGERIYFRKDGEIVAYEDSQSLSREDILKICSGKFEEDFAYTDSKNQRYRINSFFTKGKLALVIRVINDKAIKLKGEFINKIIDETGVSIDIEDDGTVSIFGKESENMKKALELVKRQTQSVELNEIYDGKVTKLMKFGAFVEVLPGKEGLLHISEISNKRVEKTEDALKEGQNVRVKVISMESEDKFNLSMKALQQ